MRLHISLPEKRETRCIDRVEVHTGISQRAARNAQRPEIKITNKKTATDNADNIAYVGISSKCADGANAFATLNEDLPAQHGVVTINEEIS